MKQFHNLFYLISSSTAKQNKIKLKGAFQCLQSKVDLSVHEADTTLALWEAQLQRLRDESSVRVITSEITMTQNNPAVRLVIRKNGEGCSNNGTLLIGNMLSQVCILLNSLLFMGPWYSGTRCGVRIPRPGFNSQRVPNTT